MNSSRWNNVAVRITSQHVSSVLRKATGIVTVAMFDVRMGYVLGNTVPKWHVVDTNGAEISINSFIPY